MKKFFDDLKTNVHVGAAAHGLRQQQPDYDYNNQRQTTSGVDLNQDPSRPLGE